MKYCIHILNYNYSPEPILKTLLQQIRTEGEQDIEIQIWDDGSDPSYFKELEKLQISYASFPFLKWRFPRINSGRSIMRQRILEYADADWNICMDSDMLPEDAFIAEIKKGLTEPGIIYTGKHTYSVTLPPPPYRLHWNYGHFREVKATIRDPYLHFSTSIFAFHKSLASSLQFEASLAGYGHEDTLFGLFLKASRIPVSRISLKAEHVGLIPFEEFIIRQENAIRNLRKVQSFYPDYQSKLLFRRKKIQNIPLLARILKQEAMARFCIRQLKKHPNRLFFLDLIKLHFYLKSEDEINESR